MDLRQEAVELIKEATVAGTRIWKACEALDISTSTFERWRRGKVSDNRKGCSKIVARKFSKEEEAQILKISCSTEYKDDNPYKIHASLLNKGIYIASVRSFYRVLKKMDSFSIEEIQGPGQVIINHQKELRLALIRFGAGISLGYRRTSEDSSIMHM